MFISPYYVDRDLVEEILDYFDVVIPESLHIETTHDEDHGHHLGGGKIPAGVDRKRRSEQRESFTRLASPGRLVNEALAAAKEELHNVEDDPNTIIVQRGLLVASCKLTSTKVSQIPEVFRQIAPIMG